MRHQDWKNDVCVYTYKYILIYIYTPPWVCTWIPKESQFRKEIHFPKHYFWVVAINFGSIQNHAACTKLKYILHPKHSWWEWIRSDHLVLTFESSFEHLKTTLRLFRLFFWGHLVRVIKTVRREKTLPCGLFRIILSSLCYAKWEFYNFNQGGCSCFISFLYHGFIGQAPLSGFRGSLRIWLKDLNNFCVSLGPFFSFALALSHVSLVRETSSYRSKASSFHLSFFLLPRIVVVTLRCRTLSDDVEKWCR